MLRIFRPDDSLVAESADAYAMDRGAWCFLHVVHQRHETPLQVLPVDLHDRDAHLRTVLARGRNAR